MRVRILVALFSVLLADGVFAAKKDPLQDPRTGLSPIRANVRLQAELDRYRMKAYRFTDGTNAFEGVHFTPKAQGAKRFPLVVFVPGSGERGTAINIFNARRMFERVTALEFQRRHPCHLLAITPPVSLSTWHGGFPGKPNAAQRLAHDFIKAICRASAVGVDGARVYLTGLSYGGSGAYALALHYPGSFAAVVPISSLPPLEEYFDERHPGNWWHFFNEGDYMRHGIARAGLYAFRDRTNAAGGDFRIGSYPEEHHDAWSKTWQDDSVWDWMFSKSLNRRSGERNEPGPIDLSGAVCTASVPGLDVTCGPERVMDGLEETGYRPFVPLTRKDWWQVRFAKPVTGKVEIVSGNADGTQRLVSALVEVSSDGRNWRRAGSFSSRSGSCSFRQSGPFAYLRIRPLSDRTPPFILRRLVVLAGR